MATTLNGNARPRVTVKADVSQLSGNTIGGKTLGIVAELPFLQQSTPVAVTTQQAMRQLMSGDDNLEYLAHLVYNASNDPKITTAPNSIVLVNSQPTTAAVLTVDDIDGDDTLTVTSQKYGAKGNQSTFKSEAGTSQGFKLTATAPWSAGESYDDVGGSDIVSFRYTGSDADTMAMTFDKTSGLRITYSQASIALGTFTTPDYPFDGIITVTPSTSWTGTAVITGTNKATGAADTETLTWTADGSATPSTKSWSAVTSIVFAASSGTPSFTISGYSFDLDVADYTYASQMVDQVTAAANFTGRS